MVPARTLTIPASGVIYLQWPLGEPADVLDYYLDITAPLSCDTVTNATVSSKPSGSGELQATEIVMDATGNVVCVWFSGGIASRVYQVQIDVQTAAARTFSWLVTLPFDPTYAIPPIPFITDPFFGASLSIPGAIELESSFWQWELESGLGTWNWG